MRRPRKKLNIGFLAYLSVAFTLGALLMVLIGLQPLIKWNWEFAFADILGALLTFLFAVSVAWFIERRVDSNRSEKEILIAKVDGILSKLKDLKDFIESGSYDYRICASRIKDLRVGIEKLLNCMQALKYDVSHTEAQTSCGRIKDILTDNEFAGKIQNNIVTLEDIGLATAVTCFSKIENELFEIQIQINQSV